MAKNKIDKTDLLVLKSLQENCRITNLELSKKIKLSPAPTLERIKKLERLEIVEGYHAKVNPDKVGLTVQTFVFITLAWKKKNALNKFIEKIQGIPEIIECHIVTGEADVVLKIICKDKQAYETLLVEKLSQIDEVEQLRTQFILSTVKNSVVLPLEYGTPRTRRKRSTGSK